MIIARMYFPCFSLLSEEPPVETFSWVNLVPIVKKPAYQCYSCPSHIEKRLPYGYGTYGTVVHGHMGKIALDIQAWIAPRIVRLAENPHETTRDLSKRGGLAQHTSRRKSSIFLWLSSLESWDVVVEEDPERQNNPS